MVLKNREVWEETYIPSRILYRDECLSKLEYFLKPALEGGRAHNTLCIGDYGTGKTASARFVIQNLASRARKKEIRFKSYYLNCAELAKSRKSTTVGRIITQCLREDGLRIYPTLPHEMKLEMLKKHVINYDSVVFVLDEIDYYLSNKKNDFETLAYLVTRSLPNTSMILITNKFWVSDYLSEELDSRVQDTFTRRLRAVSFGDYTEEELYGILADRARIGLEEGSYYPETLDYIAHLSFVNGWRARGVMNITRDAAELADEMGDEMITEKHVDKVADTMPEKEFKEVIRRLDPPTVNILFYLVNRKGEAKEPEVLDWFVEKSPKIGISSGRSRTTFYTSLSRLKGMELVESEVRGRGRGKGRYAILRIQKPRLQLIRDVINELVEEERARRNTS